MTRYILILMLLLAEQAGATTYYCDLTATSDDAGTSWAAPLQASQVNDSMKVGDTCYFNTGIGRFTITPPTGAGSAADRTVYACSSFADTNGDGTYHFAEICGADSVTGWTIDGAGPEWTKSSGGFGLDGGYLFQRNRDTIITRVWSEAGVDAPGEWWSDGTNMRIRLWDDGNPNTVGIENVQRSAISLVYANHVEFNGLRVKYTKQRGMTSAGQGTDDTCSSYIFVRNDIFSHNSGNTDNCAIISSSLGIQYSVPTKHDDKHRYWWFENDSIGYQWAWATNTAPDPDTQIASGTNNSGFIVYSCDKWLVENCTFFGYLRQYGIYWKNGINDPADSTYFVVDSNSVVDCEFNSTYEGASGIGVFNGIRTLFVAFNIFKYTGDGRLWSFSWSANDSCGWHRFFHNTIYHGSKQTPSSALIADSDSSTSSAGTLGFDPANQGSQVKHNYIVYQNDMEIGIDSAWTGGNLYGPAFIDSNSYFVQQNEIDDMLGIEYESGTPFTFAEWQASWFDANSSRSDSTAHTLIGPDTWDFRRSDSTLVEVDSVTYTVPRPDGTTWSRTATLRGQFQPTIEGEGTPSGATKVHGAIKTNVRIQ